MNRKHVLLGGIFAAISLTLVGCGNSKDNSSSNSTSAKKQVLNWTEPTQLTTNDLSKATDTLSFNVLMNTGEGLYRLDKNGTPQPALAQKTEISKDGKTYTFDLRKDAKWSNGNQVTADDFVKSWQRTVNPKTASQDAFYLYQIQNAEAVNKGTKPLSSLGIKALDKYKLQVTLVKPVTYFKKLLSWPLFYPVNPSTVQKYGSKYGTNSDYNVYNGPFKLTKWNGSSNSWTLVKNKNYWDSKAVKLTKINDQVEASTITSYNLYKSNKVDETLLTGEQIKNNKNNPDFVKRVPNALVRLDLNQNSVPEFKNINIRKALSLAINRDQLTNQVLQDGSQPAKGFVPSNMGTNPKTGAQFNSDAYVKSGVTSNLEQAKQLLEKGYKETGTKQLHFDLLVAQTDTNKQTAEFIQSELAKLPNVKVTISQVPFQQLIASQHSKNFQSTLANWQSVFADPINFLDVFESNASYNNVGYKSSTFDKLISESENQYANDPEKRWDALVKAEKVLMNDQATIPLYQAAKSQLLRSNVKGISFNPAGVPYDFKNAYIK